jgi:hypothetical protein
LLLADLLRQSIYSRMAGYEDVNDAERLAHDPTFRLIGSEFICNPARASLASSGPSGAARIKRWKKLRSGGDWVYSVGHPECQNGNPG